MTFLNIGITSVGSGVGEGIIKALRFDLLLNVNIRIIGMDASPLKAGTFLVDQFYQIPRMSEEDEYIDTLQNIVSDENIQLLLAGMDEELQILSFYKQAFQLLNCQILVSQYKVCKLSLDKYKFGEFCKGAGVNSYVYTELLANDDGNLLFPLIVKPRKGEGSRDLHLIKDQNAYQKLIERFIMIGKNLNHYIAQELIGYDGIPEKLVQKDEISAQYYVSKNGQILGHFISINWLKDGVPTQIIPFDSDNVYQEGKKMVEALIKIGLKGPINLQGKLINQNKIKFFEINTRFTGITDIRAKMGYREVEAAIAEYVLNYDINKIKPLLTFDTNLKNMGVRSQDSFLVKRSYTSGYTVFVTGANGLIGKHLIKALLVSHRVKKVIAGVRSGEMDSDPLLEVRHGSLSDGNLWNLTKSDQIDVVIHCAALRLVHEKDPNISNEDFHQVNVIGTRNLLELCRKISIPHFIFLSSQQVYGQKRMNTDQLWKETDLPNPSSIYGKSKWMGELLCQEYSHRMKIDILRCVTIYKENDPQSNMILNKFSNMLLRGEKLNVYHPNNRLDFLHINDLLKAIHSLIIRNMTQSGVNIFNIGSGSPITVGELARLYDDSLTFENDIHNDIQYGVNIDKIRGTIGWMPQISTKSGVFLSLGNLGGVHGGVTTSS